MRTLIRVLKSKLLPSSKERIEGFETTQMAGFRTYSLSRIEEGRRKILLGKFNPFIVSPLFQVQGVSYLIVINVK
jgi:hypothetical protein